MIGAQLWLLEYNKQMLTESDKERFWSKVLIQESVDACWPWTGSVRKPRDGYGQFSTQHPENAVATHCKNGHEFTERNTYTRHRPGGGRICKTCIYARAGLVVAL